MSEPNRRILVCDDNRAIHDDIRKILRGRERSDLADMEAALFGATTTRAGASFAFELTSATRARGDRLVRTAGGGVPFALAIVDIRMPPGIDGIQTIEGCGRSTPISRS